MSKDLKDITNGDVFEDVIQSAQTFVSLLNKEDLTELKEYEFDKPLEVEWFNYGMFVGNMINTRGANLDTINKTISLFVVVDMLKNLGAYAAAYNYIGKGKVEPHTDSELSHGIVTYRALVPIVETSGVFRGHVLDAELSQRDGEFVFFEKEVEITNKPVLFSPDLTHSFEQNDDNGHYIIVDFISSSASEKDISNYTQYAIAAYS